MGEIVSYNPIEKEYKFDPESLWVETLWATIYADNLSETAKIVFASMILYVREEPLNFPTQKELAEAVNKSTRTVERAVSELKNLNLISVPDRADGRCNKYQINTHYSADLKFTDKADKFLEELLSVEVPVFAIHKMSENEEEESHPASNLNSSSTKSHDPDDEEEYDEKKDNNLQDFSNKMSTTPDKFVGSKHKNSITTDKNVGCFKEKENKEEIKKEKKEKEKKESNIKKEKKEKIREKNKEEKKEKEIAGKASDISSINQNNRKNSLKSTHLDEKKEKSDEKKEKDDNDLEEISKKYPHLSKSELRQMKIREKRKKSKAEKTLPRRSKKASSLQKVPNDLSKWSPKHFRLHFGVRYKELAGEHMIRQPKKSNILIANVMKKGVSRKELKEVIDFVFDEWSEIKKRLSLESGYPSIGFVFSGYFETLLNMKRAGFSANSFKDVRSDFEFDLKLSDKEFKKKND